MHHDVVVAPTMDEDICLSCDCGWVELFSSMTALQDLVEAAKKHEEISDA